MSNTSIKSAFERMWHHIVTALSNKLDKSTFAEHLTDTELVLSSANGTKFKLTIDDDGTLTVSEIVTEEVE